MDVKRLSSRGRSSSCIDPASIQDPSSLGLLPAKDGHMRLFCPVELKQTSFGWASRNTCTDKIFLLPL